MGDQAGSTGGDFSAKLGQHTLRKRISLNLFSCGHRHRGRRVSERSRDLALQESGQRKLAHYLPAATSSTANRIPTAAIALGLPLGCNAPPALQTSARGFQRRRLSR